MKNEGEGVVAHCFKIGMLEGSGSESRAVNNLRSKFRAAIFVLLSLIVLIGSPVWAAENQSDQAPLQTLLAATDDSEDVNDPLEQVNRWIFAFNEFFQDVLLRPLSTLYNEAVPAVARTGISNFLNNLKAPVTLANNILQGDIDGAMTTLGRFIVNSTVGIAGFADVAANSGLEGRGEDFGQTLGVWGAGEGFYLVLPIFGPSNPRDLVGKFFVDPFFDPLNMYLADADRDEEILARSAANGLVEYASVVEELNQIKKTSVDYYATIRSLYRQKRKSEISNGEDLELPPIPDLDFSYDMTPEDFNQPLAGADSLRPQVQ